MRRFARVACIDWSGAAVARPSGLALAIADANGPPRLLTRAGGWSRGDMLDWLLAQAAAGADMLIGLDLSPGLPFADRGDYFPDLPDPPRDAKALWRMVDARSARDPHLAVTGFLADPAIAAHFRQHRRCGERFGSGRGRLRRTEQALRALRLSPSSCFNLVGPSQVGKSSLTGMRVLHRLNGSIPVWPFDPLPAHGPAIVEIYPAIAARATGTRGKLRDPAALDHALRALGSEPHVPLARYDDHATDALLTAAWLRRNAAGAALWHPASLANVAATEGWTFGAT